ncbi:hypothetical protein LY78DRAFT_251132 [Colletotrichum sublineola]|nr:hypothetical protein LY78DRAFT_251132 [Colletotrichum sublineola]
MCYLIVPIAAICLLGFSVHSAWYSQFRFHAVLESVQPLFAKKGLTKRRPIHRRLKLALLRGTRKWSKKDQHCPSRTEQCLFGVPPISFMEMAVSFGNKSSKGGRRVACFGPHVQ